MTSTALHSVAHSHSRNVATRAIVGIAVALAVIAVVVWALAIAPGTSSPGSGRPFTPQNSPVPTTQEIAAHQR